MQTLSLISPFLKKTIRCIRDCTAIDIETTSNPDVKRVTYSAYYGGNVSKILVGMSPAGAITFCSLAYPGGISDSEITEDSLIRLNMIDAGDDVCVDKGFVIHHIMFGKGVGVVIPVRRNKNREFTREIN